MVFLHSYGHSILLILSHCAVDKAGRTGPQAGVGLLGPPSSSGPQHHLGIAGMRGADTAGVAFHRPILAAYGVAS